jgi:hypothetical protein
MADFTIMNITATEWIGRGGQWILPIIANYVEFMTQPKGCQARLNHIANIIVALLMTCNVYNTILIVMDARI